MLVNVVVAVLQYQSCISTSMGGFKLFVSSSSGPVARSPVHAVAGTSGADRSPVAAVGLPLGLGDQLWDKYRAAFFAQLLECRPQFLELDALWLEL